MIPVTRPLLGDAEHAATQRPLTSGWITQGPEVAAFEGEFAEVVEALGRACTLAMAVHASA